MHLLQVFYGVEVLNKFVIPLALVQISRISYAGNTFDVYGTPLIVVSQNSRVCRIRILMFA